MSKVFISGTGIYIPKSKISNQELVDSYNTFVQEYNEKNPDKPLPFSSSEFIKKASGIESRHVIEKEGILDPQRMKPHFPIRGDDEVSLQCEISLEAAKEALKKANKDPSEIDCVIVAASVLQRSYPSISVEVQKELGTKGFAFDMAIGCSSGIFGLFNAYNALKTGQVNSALVIIPEINSGHVNFKDRDTHFIFGDAACAVVLEREKNQKSSHHFEILGIKLSTVFSNNIRNNFGFLNSGEDNFLPEDKLCTQKGRKVFREVVPYAANLIKTHLKEMNIPLESIKRYWLHQANGSLNALVLKYVLGREALPKEAPLVLSEYGNTSSAGAIITFNNYQEDFLENDLGVICAFGAGYSAGCVSLKKV
jgi:beta-ketodecanoyl-[acyl-carrier-protein] synthase